MMVTPLEPGFEPTSFDIICARGRTAYNHAGNQRFRSLLEKKLDGYKYAKSKQEKSLVVNAVLGELRPNSRFVRIQGDGRWYEVPDHVAKEKIGQGFRDLLHSRYRSSTKSKVKLRRERRNSQRNKEETESVWSRSESKGHRPTNSSETLEPLPLEGEPLVDRSPESLIYDCPPFAFSATTVDDSKEVPPDDNDHLPASYGMGPADSSVQQERMLPLEVAHTREPRHGEYYAPPVTPGGPWSTDRNSYHHPYQRNFPSPWDHRPSWNARPPQAGYYPHPSPPPPPPPPFPPQHYRAPTYPPPHPPPPRPPYVPSSEEYDRYQYRRGPDPYYHPPPEHPPTPSPSQQYHGWHRYYSPHHSYHYKTPPPRSRIHPYEDMDWSRHRDFDQQRRNCDHYRPDDPYQSLDHSRNHEYEYQRRWEKDQEHSNHTESGYKDADDFSGRFQHRSEEPWRNLVDHSGGEGAGHRLDHSPRHDEEALQRKDSHSSRQLDRPDNDLHRD